MKTEDTEVLGRELN